MAHQELIENLEFPSSYVYVGDDKHEELINYLRKDQANQQNLQETLADRNNRIGELTEELENISTELRSLLNKHERLMTQLAEKEEKLKTFEIASKENSSRLLSVNEKVSELKELLQKEQQNRKMDQLSFNMVNSQVNALQNKNATLVASVDGYKMCVERLKLENQECQEVFTNMLAQIEELKHKNKELEQKKDEVESEKIEDLEREVIEVNARLLCAEEDRDRFGAECKTLYDYKMQLSIQNNELNREVEQLNKRIEKLEAKNMKLADEKSSITDKIVKIVAENDALNEEKNCYVEQIRCVLDEVTTLKSKNAGLSDVCDKMKQQIEGSNKMYDQLSNDYSTKRAEYDNLVLSTQQLQIENAELKSTKEEAQNQRRESDHDYFKSLFMQIKNDNLQFHQTNAELRDHNEKLKEKARQAEIGYQQLLQQNRQLKERQTVLERDQLELKTEKVALGEEMAKLVNDNLKLATSSVNSQHLEAKHAQLVQKIEQQNAEMEKMLKDVQEGKLKVQEAEAECGHLLGQISELEHDKAELREQLRSHQSLASECMITDIKYQSLKESLDTITSELNSKTEQVEALKFAIGDVGKLYAKLQGEAVKLCKQAKFYESVNLFKRAIALEKATNNQPSTLAWLNYWLAKSYYQWKHYDEVINFCNKSISHLPDICAPVGLRAKALYKLEKYEDAHKELERTLGKTATNNQKVVEMMKACEQKMRRNILLDAL